MRKIPEGSNSKSFNNGDGTVYGLIEIAQTDFDSLLGTTKHEIGHNFNLMNCAQDDPNRCPPGTSIMGPGHPTNSRQITECDDKAVRRLYCPDPTPEPSCTPALANGSCPDGYNPAIPGFCCPADGEPGCPEGTWGYTHPRQECNGTYYDCTCDVETPVLVDVAGDGYALTDAANGVDFDINAEGRVKRIAWTAVHSDDAWLVLDRNGNGVIDDATELFGDATPQPVSAEPNGFLALAVFDGPPNGGNGDGVISSRDAIFMSLRLWQDMNHDGLSEPNELHALPALGVESISLDYRASGRRDRHGNLFRYRAKVYGSARGGGRWAYDVFLLREQ